jgi:hypothetical protein
LREAAMLSERDRQVLGQIEDSLTASDPKFVAAMRRGRPRAPREYGRLWMILLVVLGVASFVVVTATGHPLAVVSLIVVGVTGLVRFVSRHLDGA